MPQLPKTIFFLFKLYPSDQQIQQFYKEDFESARQYAKKLTIVNLFDTNAKSGTDSGKDSNASVDHQHQQQVKQQEQKQQGFIYWQMS